jgi:hypothetical protein
MPLWSRTWEVARVYLVLVLRKRPRERNLIPRNKKSVFWSKHEVLR